MNDDTTLEPPPRAERHPIARRRDDTGPAVVSKQAAGAGRSRLRREAEVLHALRGHGVVELLGSSETEDGTELLTLDAGRSTLAAQQQRPYRWRRRAFAAAAESLGAIHRTGWGHGAATLDHAVVDSAGSVRWCSLGSAQSPGDAAGAIESDRRLLAAAALRFVPDGPGGRRLRRRILALGPCPAADELARTIRPTAGPSPAGRPSPPTVRRARRVTPGRVAVSLAATAAVLAVATGLGTPPSGPGAATVRARDDAAATAPRGRSAPTVVMDGVTMGVGRAGDVATSVDPGCRGRTAVLLLRPATGEVFAFTTRPTGRFPVAGRAVARVPGAIAWLPPEPCAPAIVRRSDGTTLGVDPG